MHGSLHLLVSFYVTIASTLLARRMDSYRVDHRNSPCPLVPIFIFGHIWEALQSYRKCVTLSKNTSLLQTAFWTGLLDKEACVTTANQRDRVSAVNWRSHGPEKEQCEDGRAEKRKKIEKDVAEWAESCGASESCFRAPHWLNGLTIRLKGPGHFRHASGPLNMEAALAIKGQIYSHLTTPIDVPHLWPSLAEKEKGQ